MTPARLPRPAESPGSVPSRRAAGLKWVLGETLIVVVGVLIALTVDNWREQRRDARTEAQYLSSLIQDLESDFRELDRAGDHARAAGSAARRLYDVLEGQAQPPAGDSLARAVEHAGFLYFPTYFPYTFDELVSSGNLRVIRDPELRREIAAYYNLIQSEQQWWDRYRGIQARYTAAMQGTLSPDIRSRIAFGDDLEVSEEERMRILRALSTRADLSAALEGMVWLQDRQLRWHEVSRTRGERLRDLVNAALSDPGSQD